MKTQVASTRSASAVLDRVLEPLARRLTPAAARALVDFRLDEGDQVRIAELAEKCNEDALTPEEREEYEAYVRVGDLVTVLQSKARRLLKKTRKPG